MKHSILLLAIFSLFRLQAQFTDGQVAVLALDSEGELFELQDSTAICALSKGERFLEVHGLFFVKEGDIADGSIERDAVLYNKELQACGRVLQDLSDLKDTVVTGRKYKSYRLVELQGRIHPTRLQDFSIPESAYEAILKNKSRVEQDAQMEEMLEKLAFEKKEEGDMTYWIKRQKDCSLEFQEGKEPFRMMIVLRGGRPYCVVTNGTDFQAPKLKETLVEEPYRFYYFQKGRADVHEAIKEVMYSYVPL